MNHFNAPCLHKKVRDDSKYLMKHDRGESLFLRLMYIVMITSAISLVWFMVINTTLNNISVILRKPPTCRKLLTNFITYCCIEYTSWWTRFELTTLMVIGTDCTESCKSNNHTITTTMAPHLYYGVLCIAVICKQTPGKTVTKLTIITFIYKQYKFVFILT
jgi:hypothetical protein